MITISNMLNSKTNNMVTVINYKRRETEQGKEFFVLEVQGGVEMVRSRQTNNFYATAKKSSIPTTFDEQTCQALVGTQIEGRIVKVDCEPYDYTVKETGEIIELTHRYVYTNEEESYINSREFKDFASNIDNFSKNGVMEHSH